MKTVCIAYHRTQNNPRRTSDHHHSKLADEPLPLRFGCRQFRQPRFPPNCTVASNRAPACPGAQLLQKFEAVHRSASISAGVCAQTSEPSHAGSAFLRGLHLAAIVGGGDKEKDTEPHPHSASCT